MMRAALFLISLAAVCAIPASLRPAEKVIAREEAVAPVKKCSAVAIADCMADDCCNWCGLDINTTIGFCLPMLPKPIPSLTCARDPPTCATQATATTCADTGTCKWVPTGSPASGKGMCVYDWDKCKTPGTEIAAKPVLKSVKPSADNSSFSCGMSNSADCDARACCQWCGAAGGSGFCMPVIEWPTPTLTCSKSGVSCTGITSQSVCDQSSMCTWHPYGPRGSTGPGICTLDAQKCSSNN